MLLTLPKAKQVFISKMKGVKGDIAANYASALMEDLESAGAQAIDKKWIEWRAGVFKEIENE